MQSAARCALSCAIVSSSNHDGCRNSKAARIPSGMIFIRNRNGSHNPDEAMDIGDFMQGVQVLSDAVDQLA